MYIATCTCVGDHMYVGNVHFPFPMKEECVIVGAHCLWVTHDHSQGFFKEFPTGHSV